MMACATNNISASLSPAATDPRSRRMAKSPILPPRFVLSSAAYIALAPRPYQRLSAASSNASAASMSFFTPTPSAYAIASRAIGNACLRSAKGNNASIKPSAQPSIFSATQAMIQLDSDPMPPRAAPSRSFATVPAKSSASTPAFTACMSTPMVSPPRLCDVMNASASRWRLYG